MALNSHVADAILQLTTLLAQSGLHPSGSAHDAQKHQEEKGEGCGFLRALHIYLMQDTLNEHL